LCEDCLARLESSYSEHSKELGDLEVIAPFTYEAPASEMVVAFKYGGMRSLAGVMAPFMARRLGGPGRFRFLAPVPLHPARVRERGFSQTELLARAISEILGIPVLRGLRRRRYTTLQVELSGEERGANVRGAFRYKGPEIQGPVLVVDDVATTGSTMAEVAGALPCESTGLVFALANPGQDSR